MITFEEAQKHVCRDCEHFLYPEPSPIYPNLEVSHYCKYACHIWSDGRTYTTGGQKACIHFEQKSNLTLIFDYQ